MKSKIEWTEQTWNPVTGCTKVSAGCMNCYAERMSARLKAMRARKYAKGFGVAVHYDALEIPLKRKKPTTFFVNSMSDLFHEDVSYNFIWLIFGVMNMTPQHRYQVLTKRSANTLQWKGVLTWTDNIWMGVSVENSDYLYRIVGLRKIPAKIRFLSLEPLLGPLPGLDLTGIHWVIVGGESGSGARPMREEWVLDIRDQCLVAGIPFFFKQWGGMNRKKAGRLLEGRTWDEVPE